MRLQVLQQRENIASMTSEADLQSAGVIHQVNQQTRATVSGDEPYQITLKEQEEAAGFLPSNEQ